MSFGNELRKARKAKGMTQAELAEAMGCSRRVIIFYEANRSLPKNPSATYEELGKILGVNPKVFTEEREADSTSIGVDYKLVIKHSICNEGLAGTFTMLFDWIENNTANTQLSPDDKSGIGEFREALALFEEQKKIAEQIKAIRRTYGCDD